MRLAAVICEYNPFHAGHAAHLARTREETGAEGVVAVMSGSFVQRGEPAVLSKHARAEMALRCGADLVLENPVPWSMASAERFALGGVSLAAALGLPLTLSFGSECGDLDALKRVADHLGAPEAMTGIRMQLAAGLSFASARQRAAEAVLGPDAALLREPNNLLAVEYLKAIARLRASHLTPYTLRRIATEHDGGAAEGMAPASYLRTLLREGGDPAPYMPPAAVSILQRELEAGRAPARPEALETAVLARLRTMSEAEYAALPDASEGLWRRLMDAGCAEPTLEAVLTRAKTKRYALSRLRRMTSAALLGLTAADGAGLPPYLRVLGANETGLAILREAKGSASLPLLTKPAAVRALSPEAQAVFRLEARATDLRALTLPAPEARRGGTDWETSPLILTKE